MGKEKREKVVPYLAEKDLVELNLVRCPNCKGAHFRHTGNMLIYRNYDYQGKRHSGEVDISSYLVYTCVGCGSPWVEINDQLFDASEEVNITQYDKVNAALKADTKTDPHC